MPTIYMCKGLPASGKTTWAKKTLSDSPSMFQRVNKDEIRAMLGGERNEHTVLVVRNAAIRAALEAGKSVIVDDTNLNPIHERDLHKIAEEFDADVKTVSFLDVPIEECIRRDAGRPNSVGEKVIREMQAKWKDKPAQRSFNFQRYMPPAPYIEKAGLPSAIVCDIDGTLALNKNGRSPYDWDRVGEDELNYPVSHVLNVYATATIHEIFIFSGRDEVCRGLTEEWLERFFVPYHFLAMRPKGDTRDDRIVKAEMFDEHIRDKYNVRFVLDDRNKVVKMWRAMGLPCFQVAEGNF